MTADLLTLGRRAFLVWAAALLASRPRPKRRYQDRYWDAYRHDGR